MKTLSDLAKQLEVRVATVKVRANRACIEPDKMVLMKGHYTGQFGARKAAKIIALFRKGKP